MFVKYFREKLKLFLGSFCLTFDQMLVVTFEAYIKTDEITSPCDVSSLVIL